MVEKWRPKEWEDITKKYIGHRGTDFEFGANAMLEAIIKASTITSNHPDENRHHEESKDLRKGLWYFIPES